MVLFNCIENKVFLVTDDNRCHLDF